MPVSATRAIRVSRISPGFEPGVTHRAERAATMMRHAENVSPAIKCGDAALWRLIKPRFVSSYRAGVPRIRLAISAACRAPARECAHFAPPPGGDARGFGDASARLLYRRRRPEAGGRLCRVTFIARRRVDAGLRVTYRGQRRDARLGLMLGTPSAPRKRACSKSERFCSVFGKARC